MKYRVALSFSGRKRDFVEEVARLLAERFGKDKILYDKYHEAEFARADLAFHLPPLYREQSDLVVAVLCRDYDQNEWCGLEWSAIYSLIKQRKVDEVMLCRFDLVEGKGLFGLAGFVDLDTKTPADAATLILQRLAINEGRPRDHYNTNGEGPEWPEVAPKLHWPVANHRDAHNAFARLITRDCAFRLLSIRGGTETGKSLLTKQFLRNVLGMSGIICGRFDFKGVADPDKEVPPFAMNLKVDRPTPGVDASAQLHEILVALGRRQAPTLLIFDTFERAGQAGDWVRNSLLLALMNMPWLRVVIVGQQVPDRRDEVWSDIAYDPVELTLPSPGEWYEYGLSHKREVTLEFVTQAHALCRGRCAVLAQLLGPA